MMVRTAPVNQANPIGARSLPKEAIRSVHVTEKAFGADSPWLYATGMPHFMDDTGWPFVHAILSGVMTIEETRDHQQRLEGYHRARRRYALVVDLRDVEET